MMSLRRKLYLIVFSIAIFTGPISVLSSITVDITATVPGCGDGVIGIGEQCDGSSLGGATCSLRGFSGGSISCTSFCTFNTSSCTSSGGGVSSGGGGGSVPAENTPIPPTNVVFKGRAYPRSTITLLKDAQVVATTVAGADANFQLIISNVSGGSYIFSIYSEDNKGVRSSLLTFPISVTSGVTTKVSGIFVAPTISTDKKEVKFGDNLVIFGQSTPASEITISINSEQEFFVKKKTDENGAYLLNFDTSVLEKGEHHTKSKAAVDGEVTAYSKAVTFIVGVKNILAGLSTEPTIIADINGDMKVNLVDFSVAAYWYKRPNPPASSDLNSDGKVDLIDFSIMAFNWTG